MTLASLFNDVTILGVLLLLGFIVRELVKPLQRLYIPSSVIGGAIGLILGPQVLGIIDIPSTFEGMSGVLINLIMAATVFGTKIDKSRVRGYLDYTFVTTSNYGLQLCVGVAIGMAMKGIWSNLPHGWGIMGVFSFWGGHGTAGAAGAIFSEKGVPENLGIGMILSTIGLMSAIIIGMVLVNWGLRKGYGKYTDKANLDNPYLGGVLPKELQAPIGVEKTFASGINGLALQFSFLMACMFLGTSIIKLISKITPVANQIPQLIHGMIGAAIIWPLMCKAKLDGYVDKRSISTISGFALEVVIVSAVATLRLELVTTFFIPILIYSIVMIVIAAGSSILLAKRFCKDDWFEKAMMSYGMGTGAVPTGLALVRAVDPKMESSAPDAHGVAATLFTPIFGVLPAVGPIIAINSELTLIGIGLAITGVSMLLGFLLFGRKSKSSAIQ